MTIMRTNKIIKDLDEIDDNAISSAKKCPIIPVKINETQIDTLIDTGAEVSVITRETLETLKKAKVPMDKIPIRKCRLRGAFGEQESTIACKIQLPIAINKFKLIGEFFTVEKLSYPMVIGRHLE